MTKIDAPIIRRRVKIDFASAKAAGWSRRGKEFENRLNALSFLFPAGERYFIHSVRNYMPRISDPVLRDQAERFIYQEAMHSKEHARSNEALKLVQPYGAEMEKMAEFVLSAHRRLSFKSSQLAASCAIEHFTAILADALLRGQQRLRAESDPAFADLWLWHAVEETEHKAVCFDVYQHVCGKGTVSYLHRVVVMAFTSMIIAAIIGVGFTMIKWKQRKKLRTTAGAADAPRDVKPDRNSMGAPSMSSLVKIIPVKLYFDYYRRSFHPWDHDNTHLIDEWKRCYADFGEAVRTEAG